MSDRAWRGEAAIALLFALNVLVGGLWIRSEQRNAEAWRQEYERQRALADAAQPLREKQIADLSRFQAQAESLMAKVDRLKTTVAALAAAQRPVPAQLEPGAVEPPGLVEFEPRRRHWPPPAGVPNQKRGWGPEQVTGEPDTPGAGDRQTAWASRTQDGQPEWLLLDYAEPVTIVKVLVHETYNPGALSKVSVLDKDGKETEIWSGKDPTSVGAARGVSEIGAAGTPKASRVKIYLDSAAVAGWNEIDAVGIVDDAGATHWAVSAEASSTYAEQHVLVPEFAPLPELAEPFEFGVGSKVEVLWKDNWFKAMVLKKEAERAFIHYDGWGDRFDEWATFDRIRAPHGIEHPPPEF